MKFILVTTTQQNYATLFIPFAHFWSVMLVFATSCADVYVSFSTFIL